VDSHSVRRVWAERSGEYSPDYYAYYGSDETSDALESALRRTAGRDATVLELGCSSGRHLAHLHAAGFDDLAGIEINPDAITVMSQAYPELVAAGTIHEGAFQDILPTVADGAFDAAFSVETLQHVHPDDDWLFAEVARVADVLVTVENERAPSGEVTYVREDIPLYHRDWQAIFTGLGFHERFTQPLGNDTLRVFTT
jgi:SAM-dependent methyltransferase